MPRQPVRYGSVVGTAVFFVSAIAVGFVTDVAFQGLYESLSSPIEVRYWSIVFVSGFSAGVVGRVKRSSSPVVHGTVLGWGVVVLITGIGIAGGVITQSGNRLDLEPLRGIGNGVMGPTPIEWWYHAGLEPSGYSPALATAVFIGVALSGSLLGSHLRTIVD